MKSAIIVSCQVGIFLLTSALSWAGQVTIPYEFISGEKAVAAEVNENFNAVEAAVNDNASGVASNADAILHNSSGVAANEAIILDNGSGIAANADKILDHAADIATNVDAILDNSSDISNINGKLYGSDNVFIGGNAGSANQGGHDNVYIGNKSGENKEDGHGNVFVGGYAGTNNIDGQGNVFIGYEAGMYETGSNKLYVENSGSTTPLIYGDFASDYLTINGLLMAAGNFRVIYNAGSAALPSYYSYQGLTGSTLREYAFAINDALWVTSHAWFDGDITCNSLTEISDERYKKNSKIIDGPLKKIMELDGVYYHWKVDEYKNMGFDEARQIGFIAQDVKLVVPELVKEDSKGYLSVNYSKATALVIEGMKEQQRIIEKQQYEIEKLKDILRDFANRIEKLEKIK